LTPHKGEGAEFPMQAQKLTKIRSIFSPIFLQLLITTFIII